MDYKIHISGLANGKYDYTFPIGKELFDEFGNNQVLDAKLIANLMLEKGSGWMNITCKVEGCVSVECDRCLDTLDVPIKFSSNLAVKHAKLGEDTEANSEFIIVDHSEGEIDMKQFLYDYICVNIPIKKVHPEGKCNSAMVSKLEKINAKEGHDKDSDNYSPFSGLKELIKNKK